MLSPPLVPRITSRAVALTTAALFVAASLGAGPASADPSPQEQQDQFVALLEADQVPMIDNLPALVARAHQICKELNSGTSVYAVVEEEMNGIYDEDPSLRAQAGRVHRTAVRFIAVSSEVYCPSHLTDPYVSDDVGLFAHGPSVGIRQPT